MNPDKRTWQNVRTGLWIGAGLLILACTGCVTVSTSDKSDTTKSGPLHGMMTQQLNKEFAALNVLLFDLHQTESELIKERQKQKARIKATAQNLASAAREVGAIDDQVLLDTINVKPDQLSSFRQLAKQLESQAIGLADLNSQDKMNMVEVDRRFTEINRTCNTCHALFRDRDLAQR